VNTKIFWESLPAKIHNVKVSICTQVVGHGHTYHPGVYKREKVAGGNDHPERVIDRVEAARRILQILSKLRQEWWRKPHILPGWKDSL